MSRTTAAVGVILVILVSSFLLKTYNLRTYDLWFDELATDLYASANLTVMAERSGETVFSAMAGQMKNSPHSWLYYVVVYFYSAVFGDGKALRMLSVIFSMFSLIVFYKLARLFFGCRTALYALFLMAVNPFHHWYAQEARAYAMACFFVLSALYIYFRALETGKRSYWAGFSLLGILAVNASYYSVFLFLVLGAALLKDGDLYRFRKWLLTFFVILLPFVGIHSLLADQLDFVKNAFWLSKPNAATFLFTWKIFALGYSATFEQYAAGLAVFGVLFFWGALYAYRADKAKTVLLLLLLFVPVLTVYIVSWLFMPLFLYRQLIIVSPFFYLFVAHGLGSLKNRSLQIFLFAAVVVLTAGSLANYNRGNTELVDRPSLIFTGTIEKRNYNEIMEHLIRNYAPGDVIVAADNQSYLLIFSHIIKQEKNVIPMEALAFLAYPKHLHSYDRHFLRIEESIFPVPEEHRDDLHYFSPTYDKRLILKDRNFEDRFPGRAWMLSAGWYKMPSREANPQIVFDFLNSNRRKIFSQEQDGFYLDLFVRP